MICGVHGKLRSALGWNTDFWTPYCHHLQGWSECVEFGVELIRVKMRFDCEQANCKEMWPNRNMGRGICDTVCCGTIQIVKRQSLELRVVKWHSPTIRGFRASSNYCFSLTRTALALTACLWSIISGLISHSGQIKDDDSHVGYPALQLGGWVLVRLSHPLKKTTSRKSQKCLELDWRIEDCVDLRKGSWFSVCETPGWRRRGGDWEEQRRLLRRAMGPEGDLAPHTWMGGPCGQNTKFSAKKKTQFSL